MDFKKKYLYFLVKWNDYTKRPSFINYIVGGIFFIFVLFLFNLTIIKKADKESTNPYRMKLYYSKVEDIKQGTPVYIHGVEKGYVREIDIVAANKIPDKHFVERGKDKVIELTLALNEPISLWNNYRVSFISISIFSARALNLDPGYYLDEKSTFANPVYSFDRSAPNYQPLAYYYESFSPGASLLMQENKKNLKNITRDLNEITNKINSFPSKGTLSRLVNSNELHSNFLETVNDTGIIMQEFRWYSEGYSHMYNLPSTFFINLYTKQSAIGNISNEIYNQSSFTEDLVKKINKK